MSTADPLLYLQLLFANIQKKPDFSDRERLDPLIKATEELVAEREFLEEEQAGVLRELICWTTFKMEPTLRRVEIEKIESILRPFPNLHGQLERMLETYAKREAPKRIGTVLSILGHLKRMTENVEEFGNRLVKAVEKIPDGYFIYEMIEKSGKIINRKLAFMENQNKMRLIDELFPFFEAIAKKCRSPASRFHVIRALKFYEIVLFGSTTRVRRTSVQIWNAAVGGYPKIYYPTGVRIQIEKLKKTHHFELIIPGALEQWELPKQDDNDRIDVVQDSEDVREQDTTVSVRRTCCCVM